MPKAGRRQVRWSTSSATAEEPILFEDTRVVDPVRVRFNQIRAERSRAFGDVWLGLIAWQTLELDRFCESTLPHGSRVGSVGDHGGHPCDRSTLRTTEGLHIAEDWYRRTALEDLLGVDPSRVTHARLYEALDQILPHKRQLKVHLKDRLGKLFSLDFDLLLQNVTSTFFEGDALRNPMASEAIAAITGRTASKCASSSW